MIDSNTQQPEYLYSLGTGDIFVRQKDGSYTRDPNSLPHEDWLVKVKRAGLIPDGWQPQRFEHLKEGTELDMIDMNVDLDRTIGPSDGIVGILPIVSQVAIGVAANILTHVIIKTGEAIIKAPTQPGIYHPPLRPPIRPGGGGPHIAI